MEFAVSSLTSAFLPGNSEWSVDRKQQFTIYMLVTTRQLVHISVAEPVPSFALAVGKLPPWLIRSEL